MAVIWECALRGERAAKTTSELSEWLFGSGPLFETEPTTRRGQCPVGNVGDSSVSISDPFATQRNRRNPI